jgi:ABC-2 type transport system ATP-binding protein
MSTREPRARDDDAAAALELRRVAKTFHAPHGDVRAVQSMELRVARGETVALLGPNGAGKSTAIDMVLGLAEPDAGEVLLFGAAPRSAVSAGVVGAMLQTGGLVRDLSVRELVAMIGSLFPAPLPVDDAIALAGVGAIAGRRTQTLSGGETQRVRLAVALVGDPTLLVLDEPTVAMDVESRHAFWHTMRGLAGEGRTVLFATHYLEEADAYADRAVLMAGGRVVADGPTTALKSMVGLRTITATVPAADAGALAALPGVAGAERHGDAVILSCPDSDAAIRGLLAAHPEARDIEIRGAGLEEAFLALTADPDRAEPERTAR